MATPRKQLPFIVRVLLFAVVYTLIANIVDYFMPRAEGIAYTFDWARTQRFFLIGICVAGFALLFFRLRKPRI